MRTSTRLVAFAAALVLAFGAAAAVGAAVGPIDVGGDTPMHEPGMNEPDTSDPVTTEPGWHDPAQHLGGAPSTRPEP